MKVEETVMDNIEQNRLLWFRWTVSSKTLLSSAMHARGLQGRGIGLTRGTTKEEEALNTISGLSDKHCVVWTLTIDNRPNL